jgi:hypothetical protein
MPRGEFKHRYWFFADTNTYKTFKVDSDIMVELLNLSFPNPLIEPVCQYVPAEP